MDAKLNSIIAETLHLPMEQVKDELEMSQVESWDSLQHMNLVASLEQGFGIDFTFDEIILMQSVGEIKRVLRGKGVQV